MKKSILVVFFLTITSYGQINKNPIFGFKGGLNKSYIVAENNNYYTGLELYVGFFMDTNLKSGFKIQNEIIFSYTDDYHFIEIPVLIKYQISNKYSIFAGPKLDFIPDNDNDDFEYDYQFKNFGISGVLGGQYNLTKRFFFEIRYSRSFTAQIDDLVLELYNSKRRTVRLGVGFKF